MILEVLESAAYEGVPTSYLEVVWWLWNYPYLCHGVPMQCLQFYSICLNLLIQVSIQLISHLILYNMSYFFNKDAVLLRHKRHLPQLGLATWHKNERKVCSSLRKRSVAPLTSKKTRTNMFSENVLGPYWHDGIAMDIFYMNAAK